MKSGGAELFPLAIVCQLTGKQSSLPIGHDARHKRPAAVNFSTRVVKWHIIHILRLMC